MMFQGKINQTKTKILQHLLVPVRLNAAIY